MPAIGINALNFSRFKPWFKPGGLNQLPTLTEGTGDAEKTEWKISLG